MVDMVDRNEEQLDKLWREFLEQEPDKDDLMRAIRTVPQCCLRAWKELMSEDVLGGPPTDAELVLLMQDVDELRDLIWQELLRRKPKVGSISGPRECTIRRMEESAVS